MNLKLYKDEPLIFFLFMTYLAKNLSIFTELHSKQMFIFVRFFKIYIFSLHNNRNKIKKNKEQIFLIYLLFLSDFCIIAGFV